MTSEEISELWKHDSQIDMTELGAESIKIPQLHSRYLNILIESQSEERSLRKDLAVMLRIKRDYYLGVLDKKTMDKMGWAPFLKKVIKTEVRDYLESDPDIQQIQTLYDTAASKIKILEEIIKTLNGRGYLIRNGIDWIKFQNGGM